MTTQEYQETKAELISYLNQLVDLKVGFLNELVLTRDNDKTINLLKWLISEKVKDINEFLEMDSDLANREEYAKCPKCGDKVLGDTDGLCVRCV